MKAIRRKTIIMTVAACISACLLVTPALGMEKSADNDIENTTDKETVTLTDRGRDDMAGTDSEEWLPPNRTWIRQSVDGSWQMLTDPDHGNTVGADGQSVLNSDVIAGTVNAVIPKAYPGDKSDLLELTDDWSLVDRWLDPQDISTVRVYRVALERFERPSVNDISQVGEDVTDLFDISINGTVTTAKAKPELLEQLANRTTAMQFSLLTPYTVNFDVHADLERDFGSLSAAWQADELNVCSTAAKPVTAAGGMRWEDQPVQETNKPELCIVRPAFLKTVTAGRDGASIDGMNVLHGQSLTYTLQLHLDASTAYMLTDLSINDTYSEHVKPDKNSVRVSDGDTVLPQEAYDVQWGDDHRVQVTLTAAWLHDWDYGQNHQLTVSFDVTVKADVEDGTVLVNQASTSVNGSEQTSNKVTNTVSRLTDPIKDVTVAVGSPSANGMSLYQGQVFLYQLDSSIIPANRAYPVVSNWHIDDDYDETADQYTGQWAVYTVEELRDTHGTTIAAKGARIAGSGFDATAMGGDLFTVTMRDGDFTVSATDRYLDLISMDGAHAHGWRAYVQFTRLRAGDVSNTFVETLNGLDRTSNTVTTNTPERSPSITVESFDKISGPVDGDRDTPKDALLLTGKNTTVIYRITNTGDEPLTALELSVETVAGDGKITDWQYPDNWKTLVLQHGEFVDVIGIVNGVTDVHTNRAIATGSPVISCAEDNDPFTGGTTDSRTDDICVDTAIVSEPDDWNAYVPQVVLPDTGSSLTAAAMIGIGLFITGLGLLIVVLTKRHAS